MRTRVKVWRATPLPFEFQLALDTGEWEKALSLYLRHPYHAPPTDTFDLLKLIMHRTGARVEDIKQRISDKIKLAVSLQKQVPEEVEWGTYWDALNRGDSKTISMALSGAKISGVTNQIGVAEACAVLLKSCGKNWRNELVDRAPFGTATA